MLYRQRRLPEADRLLGQILQRASGDVGALHLAGLIAQETGRLPRAASLLSKAVKLSPRAAPLLDASLVTLLFPKLTTQTLEPSNATP